MFLLKFRKMKDGKFRFVCKQNTTFQQLQNELSEKYNVYRQRVILIESFKQFGKMVFKATVVGELPTDGN